MTSVATDKRKRVQGDDVVEADVTSALHSENNGRGEHERGPEMDIAETIPAAPASTGGVDPFSDTDCPLDPTESNGRGDLNPETVRRGAAPEHNAGEVDTFLEAETSRDLSRDCPSETDGTRAGEVEGLLETEAIGDLSRRLQQLKRQRDVALKFRIATANGLASCVAVQLGYASGMDAAQRKAHWEKARAIVDEIAKGGKTFDADYLSAQDESSCETETPTVIVALVGNALPTLNAFDEQAKQCEKRMTEVVRQLPVWTWVKQFRGMRSGEITLANIIGETGDLRNYANPAKVIKRMGCAPFVKSGVGHTGKGWKTAKPPLSKEEWESFGYCGRRRSVIYNLTSSIKRACCGKNAEKEGADNPYIQKYHEAKADKLDAGWTKGHADNHGMLLCGKKFLIDLWVEWQRHDD